MSHKKCRKGAQLLDSLIDVISESVDENEKTLQEALAEEGLKYHEVVEGGLKFIKSIRQQLTNDNR